MAKPTTGVRVNKADLDKLIENLSKFGKAIDAKVGDEIMLTALEIETDAKNNLATLMGGSEYSMGGLMSSIKAVGDKEKKAAIVRVNKKYAPYVEFGTGGLVKVPAGFEEYAIQFKGKGIKEVNLPARPFLFPALFKNQKLMFDRLKKILDGFEKS